MFRSIMTWGSSSRSSKASGSAGTHEDARQMNESLYELYRPESPGVRIIFFHGLQPGDYSNAHLSTWQSEDGCCFWPQKWLVEEFPAAHVLSVSYNGALRKGSDARVDMFIIGENLLSDLLQESIEGHWHCPVILVGHSIGGLVIKELCCRAHAKLTISQAPEKAKLESFLKNIRGIFYYATPHRGSHAADKLAELIPSPMLKFFKTLNEDTARLNSYFEDICEVHYKWRLAGLGEILPTNLGPFEALVVPEASARSKDFNLVEGADHYSICRPSSKIVRSFSKLKYFLRRIDSSTAGDSYLQRIKPQTLAPLPFGPDPKYVPISHSILEAVRKALENREGSRVVTIYGEPGMGKSSLVKYVALLYEEQRKQLTHLSSDKTASFPDGVQYLFCGQRANERIKQLMFELLQGLEFGAGSAPPPDDPTAAAGVQEWNYQPTHQIQLKLRSCLAKKKVLIILDDLWEEEVLPELLFGGQGVKYLIASQRKEIWSDAEKIQLEKPHITEARRLMANYTTGLPKQGEFSENIQTVMDDIMKALEYHPLSLANVGMSIIGSRATDTNHWRAMEEDLHALLDDDTLEKYPRCYDRPYNLTVGASMMLMVECVPAQTLQLLYLIALLEVPVSERILKFFYQSIKTTKFDYRYSVQLKDLEERSVIELTMREAKQILTTHGLRIHYIREKRYRELRSLAAKILGERTGSLFVIMAAMHFAQPFLDLVTIQLEDHIRVITNGVIPRKMESGRDASPLVTQVRRHSHWIRPLFGILNLGGISDWEHQVRDCATRIILNFICNEELDNDSLTSLQARLPETTSTIRTGRFRDKSAVCAFGAAVLEIACDRRRAFSADVPPEKSVLLDWVWQSLSEGRLLSTVDQRIVDYDKYWMEVALKVGLLCAHPDPLARPSMQSVLHMLAGDVAVPSIVAFYPARFSSELEIFSYGILHDPKSGGVSKLGEKPRKFSYKQLSVATRAFSTETQIGRGGFGSVHHGVLPSSRIPIAVKNMEIRASQHETEFMAELSIISQLRHPNLIKLEGWCKDASRGKQLLVYELMPNGSLDKALFETGESEIGCLSWPQRLNIVTGIAAALHYLHHGWKHQIIHRDIKSSNILLDKEWNAKLGDFGLARLVDHQTIPRNTMVIGTYGYIAPEAIYGTFTEKTDVFAFGAVLLEIACGRRAFSSGVPVEEAVLVNWVWQSVSEGALLRTVDKRLRVYDMHWMEVLLMVGLLCSHPDPAARPSMRHVVQVLAGYAPLPSVPAFKPTPFRQTFQWFSFNVLHVPNPGSTYVLHGQKSGSTPKLEGMTKIFSYKELSAATRGFSRETIIGEGGCGTVYNGVLPSSGIPVAVKAFEGPSSDAEKAFETEVTVLSQLRHKNVIELLGWCRGTSKRKRRWRKDASEGKHFLVYELMANSSLDKVLSESGKAHLSFPRRLKIVTDIADALNYLHHGWKQTVIHRDIKPANIFLDEWWNAKLGDFGVALLKPHDVPSYITIGCGTLGYIAPELWQSGRYTEKSDSYAFGITALEVACGRRFLDITLPEEEEVLVDWLSQKASEGALLSTVDKRLGDYDEHWMKVLLTIGLMCSDRDPLARPSMAHVLQILAGDCPVPSIVLSKPEIPIQAQDGYVLRTRDETQTQRTSKDKGKQLAEPSDSTPLSWDSSSDSSTSWISGTEDPAEP